MTDETASTPAPTPDSGGSPPSDVADHAPGTAAPGGPGDGRSNVSIRTVAVIVGVVLIALIGVFVITSSDDDSADGADSPLIGKDAPVVAGTDANGATVSTDEFLGKWVVLNFFATWCAPCVKEHPQLVEFSERGVERGDSVVVSVAYQEKPDRVAEFFAENGGDWPVIVSVDGQSTLDYGVRRLPESFLISPDGEVVHKFVGGVTANDIDAAIDDAADTTTDAAG